MKRGMLGVIVVKKIFIVLFHADGVRGIEGYYGTVDKKTEKKIRNHVKGNEL